jgi:hypothetical protein
LPTVQVVGVTPLPPRNPAEILALYAWDDNLVDVTDVIEAQKIKFTPSALSSVNCYNATAKRRSFYGVPYLQASLLNHIWRPLVEKAGANAEDIPKTWDARYDSVAWNIAVLDEAQAIKNASAKKGKHPDRFGNTFKQPTAPTKIDNSEIAGSRFESIIMDDGFHSPV